MTHPTRAFSGSIINRFTGSKILARVGQISVAFPYVHGNNESLVYNKSFLSDLQYIKEKFRLQGGEIPDADFCELIKKYVAKLENYMEDHKSDNSVIFKSDIPNWAVELFYDRYKIKLIN